MRNLKSVSFLIIGIMSFAFFACEDKISPALENAAPIMAVDAWINDKPESQLIILTQTQTYFDATLPPGVSGATVTVTDNVGGIFSFVEDVSKTGNYVWKPATGQTFGVVGNKYTMHIQVNGESFEATSIMGRVPGIDSITYEATKRITGKDSIIRAQFWATDPEGKGDTYWIRTYKNGVLLSKPSEINVAFDAGFSAGGDADGVVFITPVRRGINSNDKDVDGNTLSPIKLGDSINVQINSVSLAAFDYLNQVATQTDRPGGFQELFSTPLANVSTNVNNVNANGSKAVGFFNVSSVSSLGVRYTKKK